MIYDITIIGTGPAGLQAALSATLRNKSVLLLGPKDSSTKLNKAPEINNLLGFEKISGKDLKEKFFNHIKSLDIKIINEIVRSVYALGDKFLINEVYESKTVILTLGVNQVKIIPGELDYMGQGVSYCANCDAPLYKGKVATVIGYNDEALHEAKFLSEIAKKVNFIPMKKYANIPNKLNVINGKPLKIEGGNLTLDTELVEADGIFIIRDAVVLDNLVPGLETNNGHIVVDRNMETNLKGLFAAGDITGLPYQYAKSIGEGLIASLSAVKHIDTNN